MEVIISVKNDIYIVIDVDESQKSGRVLKVVWTSPVSMSTTQFEANDLAARLGDSIAVEYEKPQI